MLNLIIFIITLPPIFHCEKTTRKYEDLKTHQEYALTVENSTINIIDGDTFNVTVHIKSSWRTRGTIKVSA